MIHNHQTIERFLNRITERWWEHRLGIKTHGTIPFEKLGPRSDGVDYVPVPFRAFFHAMEHVPKELLTGTFVDYGAGKGRALVLAARAYKFQRVVGVEISRELCEQAENNLRHVAAAARAEIICCDATTYQPPSDTTVFFFYNPFYGKAMKIVAQKIHDSLLENPRRIAIVVYRPSNFAAAIAGRDWLVEYAAGKTLSAYWRVFVTHIGQRPGVGSAVA